MLSIRWRATAGFRAHATHKMEGNARIQGPMLSIRCRATPGFRANAKHEMEANGRILVKNKMKG